MPTLKLFPLLLLLVGCAAKPKPKSLPNVDRVIFAHIAFKTPEQVQRLLGQPDNLQPTPVAIAQAACPCERFTYKQGQIEVIYIKGKADWIRINRSTGRVNFYGTIPPSATPSGS